MALLRSYKELVLLDNFHDRFDYLFLGDNEKNSVHDISNPFYKSKAWLSLREDIIIRDSASDIGIIELPINDRILVHHINPVTRNALERFDESILLNPNNLITVSYETHNRIHYLKQKDSYVERRPGDTKPW